MYSGVEDDPSDRKRSKVRGEKRETRIPTIIEGKQWLTTHEVVGDVKGIVIGVEVFLICEVSRLTTELKDGHKSNVEGFL